MKGLLNLVTEGMRSQATANTTRPPCFLSPVDFPPICIPRSVFATDLRKKDNLPVYNKGNELRAIELRMGSVLKTETSLLAF